MTDDGLRPREPIVLDAEGKVLHDPRAGEEPHRSAGFRVVHLNQVGLLPKLLIGGAVALLLLLGLTVAGVALGVFLVTLLSRTLFRSRK